MTLWDLRLENSPFWGPAIILLCSPSTLFFLTARCSCSCYDVPGVLAKLWASPQACHLCSIVIPCLMRPWWWGMGTRRRAAIVSARQDMFSLVSRGQGPCVCWLGLHQPCKRQPLASGLERQTEAMVLKWEGHKGRIELLWGEESCLCFSPLAHRPQGARLGRGHSEEAGTGSAWQAMTQGALPGVQIEEVRRRWWGQPVLLRPGWKESSSPRLCLLSLPGLWRLMTPGGYDMVQKLFLDLFRRRLSQRPTAEELEQRNILKRKWLVFGGSWAHYLRGGYQVSPRLPVKVEALYARTFNTSTPGQSHTITYMLGSLQSQHAKAPSSSAGGESWEKKKKAQRLTRENLEIWEAFRPFLNPARLKKIVTKGDQGNSYLRVGNGSVTLCGSCCYR